MQGYVSAEAVALGKKTSERAAQISTSAESIANVHFLDRIIMHPRFKKQHKDACSTPLLQNFGRFCRFATGAAGAIL